MIEAAAQHVPVKPPGRRRTVLRPRIEQLRRPGGCASAVARIPLALALTDSRCHMRASFPYNQIGKR